MHAVNIVCAFFTNIFALRKIFANYLFGFPKLKIDHFQMMGAHLF